MTFSPMPPTRGPPFSRAMAAASRVKLADGCRASYIPTMGAMQQTIGDEVRKLVGAAQIDLSRPPGDVGLFPPDSVAWKVHGDFTAMMVGGVAALLLQMLHPGALAGVWDHSDFSRDMSGRLRRTAMFVAGTTYGSTATATGLIDRVRAIHDRVSGTLPDGTPYSANDPALLTWVHAAETWCFLEAYRRYRDTTLSPADQDRYCDEVAVVAIRLGATQVPRTKAALETYLAAMRPALRFDTRTRTVQRALLSQQSASPMMAPAQGMLVEGGIDLLPGWAAAMHGLQRPALTRPALRIGVHGLGSVLRWAMRTT